MEQHSLDMSLIVSAGKGNCKPEVPERKPEVPELNATPELDLDGR